MQKVDVTLRVIQIRTLTFDHQYNDCRTRTDESRAGRGEPAVHASLVCRCTESKCFRRNGVPPPVVTAFNDLLHRPRARVRLEDRKYPELIYAEQLFHHLASPTTTKGIIVYLIARGKC